MQGIVTDQNIQTSNRQDMLKIFFENFQALENIVSNSFGFSLNFSLKYSDFIDFDIQIDLAQSIPSYHKSYDMSLFKYNKTNLSALEQNKEILSTIYSTDLKQNTIFLTNYQCVDDEWQKSNQLENGVISYKHFFDLLKLQSFKGTLVIDYDAQNFEQNTLLIKKWLQSQKYIEKEKYDINDSYEKVIENNQTDTLINI